MSVINTMLHNLDERRAGTAGKAVLPGEVIALPRTGRRAPSKLVVIIPLLGAIALATLYLWPHPQPDHLPKPIAIEALTPPTTEVEDGKPGAKLAELTGEVQANLPASSAHNESAANSAQHAQHPVTAPATVSEPSRPALAAVRATERVAGHSLTLATTLTSSASPDTPPPVRTTGRPAMIADKTALPRSAAIPAAQSLPVPAPAVAVVSPSAANASIRLEQSTQTPQERNLMEVQHAAELQRRGALAEAEASLRGVLDNDKRMVAARLALFSLLSRQQRNDEARKLLRDGLDVTPTQAQLLLPYARLLAAGGEWSVASDALVPAADALAQDAEYRALYGAVLQRLGRFPQSSIEYRAALRLAPAAGAWWIGLGLSLEGEGKRIEARNAYLQARANTLAPDLAQFVDNKLTRLGTGD